MGIIGTVQKFTTKGHQVCENFVKSGGLKVCTLIVEVSTEEVLVATLYKQLENLWEVCK